MESQWRMDRGQDHGRVTGGRGRGGGNIDSRLTYLRSHVWLQAVRNSEAIEPNGLTLGPTQ